MGQSERMDTGYDVEIEEEYRLYTDSILIEGLKKTKKFKGTFQCALFAKIVVF
ncbi:hypothetical protein ACQCVM_06930 [Rossellomorea aquimaris]|uniref:hypothetical protein n=1 Tax=Rossellomorea aquimaris TaxID=189382 RepID=UPI003CEEE731